MKRFWGFVVKEFYHISRDYRSMIVMFGIPIIQLLLFGYVLTNEIKDANIAILDKSQDNMSIRLTNKLLSSGYFKLERTVNNESDIEQAFKEGKVKIALIFENNFAQHLQKDKKANIQILADASDPNTAGMLVSYTNVITANFLREELYAGSKMPMQIVPQTRMRYNPEMKAVFMFVPGLISILLMLISAMMTSISITREKEMGTMEVLLASPLKPVQIVIGKVFPYVFLGITMASSVLIIGHFVFDVPIAGSLVLLMGECLLFITLALSLGILISTISPTQLIAMLISIVALLLPTILLSGFMFPVENMPVVLQRISQIIPTKWFLIILKNIMIKGTDFSYVWKETLVIALMTLVFIMISIKKFKTRLE